MSNEIEIGAAAHNRKGFPGKANYVYCEDNTDLVLRILPPLYSLAREGQYAKFHRIHRGIRASDGKQRAFVCPEETDFKTKLIKVHCPICDRYRELEAQLNAAKEKGATNEQVKDFKTKYMFPIQSEGKYYLHAINQAGEFKVLTLGSRHFKALKALFDKYDKEGQDLCGIKGYFLTFRKSVQFKGDKNAVHTVNLFQQPTGGMNFSIVPHDMTPEFVTKLKTETQDLSNLFKILTSEELSLLASSSDVERVKIIDRLYAKAEVPAATQVAEGPAVLAAGTTMAASSQVAPAPLVPTPAQSSSAGPFATQQTPVATQAVMATQALAPATALAPQAQVQAPKEAKSLSDEEFQRMFTPR